jgi:PhnB protein
MPTIIPGLVVKDAARAIEFYVKALGAKETSRFVDNKLGPGFVVHADLELPGGTRLSVRDENVEWGNASPATLGGSPVALELDVADADAAWRRLVDAGAEVLFPLTLQFYGIKQGRVRDPFGHLWIVSQVVEKLSNAEIQRRVDDFPHPEK